MNALLWLISASAAIWLGLGAYLAFLAVKQGELAKRLARMEHTNHE